MAHTRDMLEISRLLLPHKQRFFWAVFNSICNKILDLMPPLLVAWVIDTVGKNPPKWIMGILPNATAFEMACFLASLSVIVFGFESLFQWLYKRQFMTLAQDVQHALRMRTYNRIQDREMAFFENHRLGETLSILNDDVNQLERFYNEGFNEIIQLGVVFIFAGIIMGLTAWPLAIFALVPVPIIILGSAWYQRLVSPKYMDIRKKVGQMNSRLENNISGALVIKSFSAEAYETERVEECSNAYRNTNYQVIRLNSLYVPLIRMVIAIGFAGVLLIGGYWILSGSSRLTIGELVLFSMMIQRLLWPLTRMGVIIDDFERAGASAKRLMDLFRTPPQIQDPADPVSCENIEGHIQFDHVSFAYDNKVPVIKTLNVSIQPKKTVGVAGQTGSGKTTLIKLLLRLYDPISGQILIDGIPITQLRLQELRAQIALVSQDVYLFHGTLYENIAYGRPGCSQKEVEEASQLAEFHDFASQLPTGYATIVGERGIKLSGGQRQRLSIARAILKDAPIMIFDEATSSVDTETERAIQKNIHRLTSGKTALIIAHRLSTIRHADHILVLGNNQLLEQGTHEELVKENGIYKSLWQIQIGEVTH